MLELIREAGWPIFPVLFFGSVAVVAAGMYTARPERSRLAATVGLAIATAATGLMGTALGLQASARYVADAPSAHGTLSPAHLFLVGLRESLHCTVVALGLVALTALLATWGACRRPGVRAGSVMALVHHA